MKTDIELLFEHLENEVGYLKSEMEACVADWDFEGAKSFREPLILTKMKLRTLKSLQNPKYRRIEQLYMLIKTIETGFDDTMYYRRGFSKEKIDKRRSSYERAGKTKIDELQLELTKLESFKQAQRINDDKLLQLLDDLVERSISEIELEIVKEKIFLKIISIGHSVELKLYAKEGTRVADYISQHKTILLKKLGFQEIIFAKTINDFVALDKLELLEEISIIVFEVFGIELGNELIARVK